MQNIVQEMNIRSLSTADKTVAQMREEVRSHLSAEAEMSELIEFIDEEGMRSDIMKHMLRYVPCVMHCENRCGIKIKEMLLVEGISNAQGDLISIDENGEHDTVSKQENAYINNVQKYLNNEVLGSEGNKAQYKIPTEKRKGESTRRIGTIKMENYRMRKIINKLDKTIKMSVANNDSDGDATSSRKTKWKKCLHHYRELMIVLRKKGANYTKEELSLFEHHADHFFQLWVELHGRDGVTNYIHMIGSGHMLAYMKRWGNLTKY